MPSVQFVTRLLTTLNIVCSARGVFDDGRDYDVGSKPLMRKIADGDREPPRWSMFREMSKATASKMALESNDGGVEDEAKVDGGAKVEGGAKVDGDNSALDKGKNKINKPSAESGNKGSAKGVNDKGDKGIKMVKAAKGSNKNGNAVGKNNSNGKGKQGQGTKGGQANGKRGGRARGKPNRKADDNDGDDDEQDDESDNGEDSHDSDYGADGSDDSSSSDESSSSEESSESSYDDFYEVHGLWVYERPHHPPKTHNPLSCMIVYFYENRLADFKHQTFSEKTMAEYKAYMLKPEKDHYNYDNGRPRPLATLFPWLSGPDLETLRNYHFFGQGNDMTWQEMWALPYAQLWPPAIRPRNHKQHEAAFLAHRRQFLQHHVLAVWPFEECNSYVLHLRSAFKDREFERLFYGFLLMPTAVVESELLANRDARSHLFSDEQKARHYPWSTGAEAWRMILQHRGDKELTVTALKKKFDVAAIARKVEPRLVPPHDDDERCDGGTQVDFDPSSLLPMADAKRKRADRDDDKDNGAPPRKAVRFSDEATTLAKAASATASTSATATSDEATTPAKAASTTASMSATATSATASTSVKATSATASTSAKPASAAATSATTKTTAPAASSNISTTTPVAATAPSGVKWRISFGVPMIYANVFQ